MIRILWAFLFAISFVHGQTYYEGTFTFSSYGRVDWNWFQQLLPYNPVIIEVGAYTGDSISDATKIWPKSEIIALEPNPRVFAQLQQRIREQNISNVKAYNIAANSYNGSATLYLCQGPQADISLEHQSSLLAPAKEMEIEYQGPKIEVPCVVLEDFCKENQIAHIDVLKLDLEGLELQVLQSSPNMLKNIKVICVQSFFSSYRENMTNYFYLKDFLLRSGFVVLAHWYKNGSRGNAVYISQELYDAYFIRCLGLGTGGLSYP